MADSLLQTAARGDHGAFDLAVTQLSGPIHHLVRTLVRDRAQAEEVTQEVLFEMWRQVTRYDRAKAAQQHGHSRSPAPRHRPGPLHGSKLRPRARNAVAAVSWDQVSEALDQTLDREQLHHCVDALSSLQLQAIVLAFYGGHTYPEIAITYSAAASGQLDIAVSNILGGIALQTVVLVALDAFGVRERRPLTYQAASLSLVIEGAVVIAVLVVVVMGTQLPASLVRARLSPDVVAIALIWVAGLALTQRAGTGLPWQDGGEAPDSQPTPRGHSRHARAAQATRRGVSTAKAAVIFLSAAAVTLAAGALAEESGSADYKLAFGDIFGGNAFLPVLFLLATVVSGRAVLPNARASDIYLTGLGALLTVIYMAGLLFRPKHQHARLGVDSIAVLVIYLIGVAGLIALPS